MQEWDEHYVKTKTVFSYLLGANAVVPEANVVVPMMVVEWLETYADTTERDENQDYYDPEAVEAV